MALNPSALTSDRASALSVTHTIASPTVPSTADDGIDLQAVEGLRIILSAEATRTLSGAGTIDFYLYDYSLGAWIPNPDLQISMSSAYAGNRRVVFPDQAVFVGNGRVAPVPNGVTVSGGTTIVLTIVVYRGR